MAEITASEVKALRDRTGAGMMDCKKALVACEGDIEKSIDWLRKKGLSAAAKKSGRVAAEGLVGIFVNGNTGTVLEVNAETDFVARNDLFQKYVSDVVKIASEKVADLETLKNSDYPGTGRNVSEELTNLIATIGENMSLRRVSHLSVKNGVVASYVHNKIADNLGKIGILVGIESTADKSKLLELGKKIAMHIAAASPKSVNVSDLDPEIVARERDVVTEQARNSGKKEEFAPGTIGYMLAHQNDSPSPKSSFVDNPDSFVSDFVKNYLDHAITDRMSDMVISLVTDWMSFRLPD